MSEYYENYNEGPQNNPSQKDRGTAPLVLGILSIVFSLTFSRFIGLVLGIIAICLGNPYRHEDRSANAGFIMGVVGLCLSLVVVAIFFFSLMLPFVYFF